MLERVAKCQQADQFSNKVCGVSPQESPLISFGLNEKSNYAPFAELKKPLHVPPERMEKPLGMTLGKGWWSINWYLKFKSRRLSRGSGISLQREQKWSVPARGMLCKSELNFWTKNQPSFCYHNAQETKRSIQSWWSQVLLHADGNLQDRAAVLMWYRLWLVLTQDHSWSGLCAPGCSTANNIRPGM